MKTSQKIFFLFYFIIAGYDVAAENGDVATVFSLSASDTADWGKKRHSLSMLQFETESDDSYVHGLTAHSQAQRVNKFTFNALDRLGRLQADLAPVQAFLSIAESMSLTKKAGSVLMTRMLDDSPSFADTIVRGVKPLVDSLGTRELMTGIKYQVMQEGNCDEQTNHYMQTLMHKVIAPGLPERTGYVHAMVDDLTLYNPFTQSMVRVGSKAYFEAMARLSQGSNCDEKHTQVAKYEVKERTGYVHPMVDDLTLYDPFTQSMVRVGSKAYFEAMARLSGSVR